MPKDVETKSAPFNNPVIINPVSSDPLPPGDVQTDRPVESNPAVLPPVNPETNPKPLVNPNPAKPDSNPPNPNPSHNPSPIDSVPPNTTESIAIKIARAAEAKEAEKEELNPKPTNPGIANSSLDKDTRPFLKQQHERKTNPERIFPSESVYTILKLKGMDSQQASQALEMLRDLW